MLHVSYPLLPVDKVTVVFQFRPQFGRDLQVDVMGPVQLGTKRIKQCLDGARLTYFISLQVHKRLYLLSIFAVADKVLKLRDNQDP